MNVVKKTSTLRPGRYEVIGRYYANIENTKGVTYLCIGKLQCIVISVIYIGPHWNIRYKLADKVHEDMLQKVMA